MESFTTSNEWSFAESKMFEAALAALDLNEANWLEKLAAMVPTKTLDQVSNHIANLVLDGDNGIGVSTEINIMENNDNSNGYSTNVYNPQVQEKNDELGFLFMEDDIVLPSNEELMEMEMLFGGLDDLIKLPAHQAINDQAMNKQPAADLHVALKDHVPAAGKEKVLKKRVARRRRKPKRGTGWTEHEHRLFLIGLLAFGKGDWRTIATEFVKTRTSIQVASHAQKFFVRHQRSAMRRRKSSILDITSITTPIVFGSTPTSIYDMIDWHEVAARYQASVCNPIADNNDTSPFWLLMNWCPPTTNNDKASSTYLETNADVRVESFGKPTGFGSFNIAIDSIGVNNMDEEFQNDVDLQAESFGEPVGTYNFGTYAIRVNNMDEECWNNVDLQAESFGEPAGFDSSNIGTYAISVDKMNDEVWENADLQDESFGEPAGYISTDAIGVDNMDEGSWDISYLLRSPVLAPMY